VEVKHRPRPYQVLSHHVRDDSFVLIPELREATGDMERSNPVGNWSTQTNNIRETEAEEEEGTRKKEGKKEEGVVLYSPLFVSISASDSDHNIKVTTMVSIPTSTATTTPTLFIESTPFSFELNEFYNAVIALNDGSFVSYGSDHTPRRWVISTTNDNKTVTLELVGTFIGHTALVMCAAENRDNHTFITSSTDYILKEWDIRTCECLTTIKIDGGYVRRMFITKDKTKLLFGLHNGFIELRRASDLAHISTIDIHDRQLIYWCCELEDGSFVSCSKTMKRWTEDGRVLQNFAEDSSHIIQVIELKKDVIVSVSGRCELQMWKVSTGECLRTLSSTRGVFIPQLLKLSRNMFVSLITDNVLRVWNDEGHCIESIPTERRITSIGRVGNHLVASRYPIYGFSIRRLR